MKILTKIFTLFFFLIALSCRETPQIDKDFHAMSEAIGVAETNKIKEAEKLLKPILEQNPNWGEGWIYLGRSLAHQGKYVDGASAMERAGKLGERRSTVWLEASSMAIKADNKELALSYFSKALDNGIHRKWLIQNSSYDGFLYLDSLVYLPKAKELLLDASKKRASLNPDIINIEKQLFNHDNGIKELNKEEIDSLIQEYYNVVESANKNGELYYRQGKLKIRQGEFSGALEAFENAKKLNYLNVATDGWIAYIYTQLGNLNKAFEHLEINLAAHDTPNWVYAPGEFEPLYLDQRWIALKQKYRVTNFNQSRISKGEYIDDTHPTKNWQKTTPAQVGLNQELLAEAENVIRSSLPNVTSLLVVKDGKLASEKYFHGYSENDAFNIKSATKSITGILTGIMYDKQILPELDTPVFKVTPHLFKGVKDSLKYKITLEHLLTMTIGIEHSENNAASLELFQTGDYASAGLRQKQVHVPGEVFEYSSITSHILATALADVSHSDLFSFADKNLFQPLGIEPESWAKDLNGYYLGDSELRLKPKDLAKIGLLILKQGKWEGESIVSKEWIDKLTSVHIKEAGGPQIAYGYQTWIRNIGGNKVILLLGHGGQFCAVVPTLNLVCVITSEPLSPEIDADLILGEYIIPSVKN